jgi:uncharacterized protein YbjT (DUF2867 family)
MSRVLVYQANGVQGGATLRRVQQAGFTARGLIRNASRAAALIDLGFEVAVADFADREALIRAHESVDHVILQIPAYADAFVASAIDNAICAMETARVKGVVIKMANPTSLQATANSGFSANRIVQERMRSSAMPYSVVEPTMYLDTFLKPNLRREIAQERVIELPIERCLKIAWTTVDDAAKLAVSLLQSNAWGVTIRCAGAAAFDGDELAAAFTAILDRRITYRSVDLEIFRRDIESVIGPAAAAPVVAKFGFLARFPEEARRMLGVSTNAVGAPGDFRATDLHDWIRTNRASFDS